MRALAFDVKVEGAVYKLELACAALVQFGHLGQEQVEVEGPGCLVEGGEAEFAFERAAARCFDVQVRLAISLSLYSA